MLGKELLTRLIVSSDCSIWNFAISQLRFDDIIMVLIVPVYGNCLTFTFEPIENILETLSLTKTVQGQMVRNVFKISKYILLSIYYR